MSVVDEEQAASSAPTARRSSSCARRATPGTSRGATTASPWSWTCTGTFRDPHAEPDAPRGALRGHLAAGAAVVVQSSPFKSRQQGRRRCRDDAAILIHGINDYEFDPAQHTLVSAASCTTTALAHMIRPLLDRDLTKDMITAGMSTIHAVTNSQPVLDAVPKAGATDLRKTRGALGNVVLTSTNAAAALEQVMPEIGTIGFMADSVRIPTQSVSLIILNVTFQSETLRRRHGLGGARRDQRHLPRGRRGRGQGPAQVQRRAERLRRHARRGRGRGHRGRRDAHAHRLHEPAACRRGRPAEAADARPVRVPLTHVKVFGWYDNEMGSYTYRLGELTIRAARSM